MCAWIWEALAVYVMVCETPGQAGGPAPAKPWVCLCTLGCPHPVAPSGPHTSRVTILLEGEGFGMPGSATKGIFSRKILSAASQGDAVFSCRFPGVEAER